MITKQKHGTPYSATDGRCPITGGTAGGFLSIGFLPNTNTPIEISILGAAEIARTIGWISPAEHEAHVRAEQALKVQAQVDAMNAVAERDVAYDVLDASELLDEFIAAMSGEDDE